MARIQVRRDTAANWTAANPVLDEGEPGWDTTNEVLKFGDGVSAWETLPAYGSSGTSEVITDWSYRDNSRSGSALAWKGNEFTPDLDVDLHAMAYYGGLVNGATYQAAVVTGTAAPGNVATIVKSATVTLPNPAASLDGGWIWLRFADPVRLTAGTTYGLILGRTDGADTYALPIAYSGNTTERSVPMTGFSPSRSWRIAKADPQVGDAINLDTGNTTGSGYQFSYPA